MDAGGNVENADLAGQHDQSGVGYPVARRAKPIAVQHGPDHRAVGEDDGRRPVPRLHERGVVTVEGPSSRIHRGVVLPRLGNHHEHGVGQRSTTQMQELEHLVEAGGVAGPRRADRKDP